MSKKSSTFVASFVYVYATYTNERTQNYCQTNWLNAYIRAGKDGIFMVYQRIIPPLPQKGEIESPFLRRKRLGTSIEGVPNSFLQ